MGVVKRTPHATPPSTVALRLQSRAVGPMPIVNRFLHRLGLDQLLAEFVPAIDRRVRLAPAVGLGVLLRNVLVAREPMYGLQRWASRFDDALLGLPPDGVHLLNDDRVGRCLDALFAADRAALMTAAVVRAVRTFDLDMSELHNDSTSVTFTGQYRRATGRSHRGRQTHRITFGYNKDHRPDLKQLLYILTTTADGSVPVWCSVDHGNTTDDQTHIATWNTLRALVGRPDFLYVADSKLCTKENMAHIAREGGRFVTVLPKSRHEDRWFRAWMQTHEIVWTELVRKKNSRRKSGPDEVYRGFESPMRSVEGYRVLWIWSSQKHEIDRDVRQRRIEETIRALEQLRARVQSPRARLKTCAQVQDAAASILSAAHAEAWFTIDAQVVEEHRFRQAKAGRPGKGTAYVRSTQKRIELRWPPNAEGLQHADRTDGIFPLIVNDDEANMSLRDALIAYKHQPALEKRHEQFKSVLNVMPVLLKSVTRIEAFLFIYFLALLVEALIEREVRRRMKLETIPSLPLYPEDRPCKAPTTEQVFHLFEDVRRHSLRGPDNALHQRFYDELTPLHRNVLRLLGLSSTAYLSAGEGGPTPARVSGA